MNFRIADTFTDIKDGESNVDPFSEDGTEALDEVSTGPDGRPKKDGDVGELHDDDGGGGGEGASHPGTVGGTTRGGEGTSDTGDDISPAGEPGGPGGNYRITDPALNDPKGENERFRLEIIPKSGDDYERHHHAHGMITI